MWFNIDTRGHKKAQKSQNIAVGPEPPPPTSPGGIVNYFFGIFSNLEYYHISVLMSQSEKNLIWMALKAALPQLKAAGINPIEFLLWTQVE